MAFLAQSPQVHDVFRVMAWVVEIEELKAEQEWRESYGKQAIQSCETTLILKNRRPRYILACL